MALIALAGTGGPEMASLALPSISRADPLPYLCLSFLDFLTSTTRSEK